VPSPVVAQGIRVAVAWYSPAEWQRLREIAADPDALEPTYGEWVVAAETAERDLAAEGLVLERVEISIDELQAWCREHHRPIDGSARAEFAAELLRRRYSTSLGRATGQRLAICASTSSAVTRFSATNRLRDVPRREQVDYGDYRDVNGVQMPF
jgi:hypothetical protein